MLREAKASSVLEDPPLRGVWARAAGPSDQDQDQERGGAEGCWLHLGRHGGVGGGG